MPETMTLREMRAALPARFRGACLEFFDAPDDPLDGTESPAEREQVLAFVAAWMNELARQSWASLLQVLRDDRRRQGGKE